MKTCYVSLGSLHGVEEGMFLDAKSVTNIAGRTVYEEVGVLKIEKYWPKTCPNALLSAREKNYWKLSKNI